MPPKKLVTLLLLRAVGLSLAGHVTTAFTQPDETLFRAVVTCKNLSILHDTLTFTSDAVDLRRDVQLEDPVTRKFRSQKTNVGWTGFSLTGGSEGYGILDSTGHVWIPEEETRGCTPTEVDIKGVLMAGCREGTPTWRVSGEKCVEVPVEQPDSERKLWMTLSSATSFLPSFNIGGNKFFLSWAKERLQVVTADGAVPLPPHSHPCISFALSSEDSTSLQVLENNRILLALTLTSVPKTFKVCEEEISHSFDFQQHNADICENVTCTKDGRVAVKTGNRIIIYIVTSIGAASAVGILICLFCCYKKRSSQSARGSRPPSGASKKQDAPEPPSPLYLEPKPAPGCKPGDLPPPPPVLPEHRVIHRSQSLTTESYSSDSEHIYEEMSDTTSVLAKDLTYENVTG